MIAGLERLLHRDRILERLGEPRMTPFVHASGRPELQTRKPLQYASRRVGIARRLADASSRIGSYTGDLGKGLSLPQPHRIGGA